MNRFYRNISLLLIAMCLSKLGNAQWKGKHFYQERLGLLSFHHQLQELIKIDDQGIYFYPQAGAKTPQFTIFANEIDWFIRHIKEMPDSVFEPILIKKGNHPLPPTEISYWKAVPTESKAKGLSGKKIIIDPGHMAGDMAMAQIEQKFLIFHKNEVPELSQDSIAISEGMLTWQTAQYLGKLLEKEGAQVSYSRGNGASAFGIDFRKWYKEKRANYLDSLVKKGKMAHAKAEHFLHLSEQKFFLEYFKDAELIKRVEQINKTKADIAVIIHYNVDETNIDWKKPVDKNFTMTFVPGGITADSYHSMRGKLNIIRLLIGNDLDESIRLSSLTVQNFHQQLQVPIAGKEDALYLHKNCNSTKEKGVFARNLALCRNLKMPMVYGECFYQDNKKEYPQLIEQEINKEGVMIKPRCAQVAEAYFQALKIYFEEK